MIIKSKSKELWQRHPTQPFTISLNDRATATPKGTSSQEHRSQASDGNGAVADFLHWSGIGGETGGTSGGGWRAGDSNGWGRAEWRWDNASASHGDGGSAVGEVVWGGGGGNWSRDRAWAVGDSQGSRLGNSVCRVTSNEGSWRWADSCVEVRGDGGIHDGTISSPSLNGGCESEDEDDWRELHYVRVFERL